MNSFQKHFLNPIRDKVDKPYCVGIRENKEFNAKIIFNIKINEGIIEGIDYKIKACPVAIAVASLLASISKNKATQEILKINTMEILTNLDGFPDERIECALTTIEAFFEAIRCEVRDE